MKKDSTSPGPDSTSSGDGTPAGTSMRRAVASGDRGARVRRGQDPAAPSGTANVEESPHMDRGDSAEGPGESLGHGRGGHPVPPRRGAVDTQYGTKSSLKTGPQSAAPAASPPDAGDEASKGGDRPASTPNPGSSEASSGAERDTMNTSRPGGGS